jgi:hypothetical protein
MAVQRFLSLVSGALTQIAAIVSTAGAGDGGKIIATDETTGKLHDSFLPAGIGTDTVEITASEALSAGNFVNKWNDTGTAKVRKADATTPGKQADGFVLAAVDSAAAATVYPIGSLNNQLSALTPGTVHYLSATPGAVTASAPSTAGYIVQKLGTTHSATEMIFDPSPPVTLA